ncbi:putative GTP-binding protein 6 [Oryzias melastigma]|uniref:Putative GTP-binding protein 6 n=1 Tax=Oryzias melastigma TaxID=30732 RepID=A0A834CG71_ORYME|nr:putative GTP-binding protein 6 [Oryzias melastigma]
MMVFLRRIKPWLPLLHRSFTQKAAATSGLVHAASRGSPPQFRPFSLSACALMNPDDFSCSSGAAGEDQDIPGDTEVEEIFQQQVPTGVGQGQRIFIVHPDVKWGSRKQHLTTAELMMAEAVGLVKTLDSWTVVDQLILSTKTPEKKLIFGKGNFQYLTEKIRQTAGITAVFVNVERLSALSEVSSPAVHLCSTTNIDSSLFGSRGNLRKPGGSKSLTDIQLSFTFFAATPKPKRPSCKSPLQRSPC